MNQAEGERSELAAENDGEISALRSLDDFLLEAHFEATSNFEEWIQQVSSNLSYYKTNYVVLIALIFLIIGFLHPFDVFFLALLGFGFIFTWSNTPVLFLFSGLVAYYIKHVRAAMPIVFLGLSISAILIFTHASLRLLNPKRKMQAIQDSVKRQTAINDAIRIAEEAYWRVIEENRHLTGLVDESGRLRVQ